MRSIDIHIFFITYYNVNEVRYRNLVIDESNLSVIKNKTGDTLLLESSHDITSNYSGDTWKHFIRKYFSKDNHYHITRRMTVRHIQIFLLGHV